MVASHIAKDGVDLEEFDDVLHDTFAPKEKNADKEEETKDDASAAPESPVVENEMTLTE